MIPALDSRIQLNLKLILTQFPRSIHDQIEIAGMGLLILGFLPLTGGLALAEDGVRWNQIQVIGTHNSYHLAPSPAVRL